MALRVPAMRVRSMASMPLTSAPTSAFAKEPVNGKYTVSFIRGDGIGIEISEAVDEIYKAAKVPIVWENVSVAPFINKQGKQVIPDEAIESIKKNTVALKGECEGGEQRQVLCRAGMWRTGVAASAPGSRMPRFLSPLAASAHSSRQARSPRPSARATSRST